MNAGKLVQVIGPVIDVEFPSGMLPAIQSALKIPLRQGGADAVVTAEVAQHLGDNTVRALVLGPTEGMCRGMAVQDTGAPIMVPVGEKVLGRLIDVLGEPKDELGPIQTEERMPIHRSAPSFEEQETIPHVFETGIKVIDLLEPYRKGGKVGLFGGAGVG
ncbi:MAG TPA: F0F1 ATP synthase subunit beta, partial [Elusimicrobia bacterium]|nr:F0F1 ATP synthase subunit beta [Elusimicrobiota bacterium]